MKEYLKPEVIVLDKKNMPAVFCRETEFVFGL